MIVTGAHDRLATNRSHAMSESLAAKRVAPMAARASPVPNATSTMAEMTVTDLFSISAPVLQALSINIANNLRERYGAGSPNPSSHGRGWFHVTGSAEFYFGAAADYSTFATRQQGLDLDVTIGSVTLFKDKLQLMNCDVWNPNLRDPGPTGDHTVILNFMAKYNAADAAAIKLTRNVA